LRCIGGIVPGCAIAGPSPIASLAATTTVPFLVTANEAVAADTPATNHGSSKTCPWTGDPRRHALLRLKVVAAAGSP
jgi:hypothetical protein